MNAEKSGHLVRGRRKQEWFEQRRDFFMRRVFEDFFAIVRSFQDVYQVYLGCKGAGRPAAIDLLAPKNDVLRAKIWDRLTLMVGTEVDKGPLWQLKDLCHRIWPEDGQAGVPEGALVDWLVGLIFHEAMKLKENVYILGRYGPATFRMRDPETVEVSGSRDLTRIMDVNELIHRVKIDVTAQMDQLAFLFGQTSYILRTMLPWLSENMLVVRLLAEQEDVVQELWGEGTAAVFAEMFHRKPEQGFCAAGKSYLQGQWSVQARDMYQRALSVNSDCFEADRCLKELLKQEQKSDEVLPENNEGAL